MASHQKHKLKIHIHYDTYYPVHTTDFDVLHALFLLNRPFEEILYKARIRNHPFGYRLFLLLAICPQLAIVTSATGRAVVQLLSAGFFTLTGQTRKLPSFSKHSGAACCYFIGKTKKYRPPSYPPEGKTHPRPLP